jgi:uncharacterized protein (TIGR03382 family)
MSRTAVIVLVLTGWVGAARGDCDNPFADPRAVLDLHLRMSRSTFSALVFDELVDNGTCLQYPEHPIEFRCGDAEPWISVAARRKRGDQRGMQTDQKPSIKLDINEVVQGQRWPAALGELGYRKLSLNMGQSDGGGNDEVMAVMLSEKLGLELLRAEVPATPASVYARVDIEFVDDGAVEPHGLYILIEDIDRTALRRRWGDGAGRLYKNTGSDCDGVVFDDGPLNAALTAFTTWEGLAPNAYPGTWASESDRAMHLDELIRQEAIREIVANEDNIFNDYRNYLAFDPAAGRRHWIPWDLDGIFRPLDPRPADEPLGSYSSVMGRRIRDIPETRRLYMQVVCDLVNGTMSADRIVGAANDLDAIARPILAEEVEAIWGGRDPFDPSGWPNYQTTLDLIRSWVPDRIAAVRAEVEANGVTCPIGCPSGATQSCEYLSCPGERRCEASSWTPCAAIEPSCGQLIPPDAEPDPAGPTDDVGGCGCQSDSPPITLGVLAFLLFSSATARRRHRRGRSAPPRGCSAGPTPPGCRRAR